MDTQLEYHGYRGSASYNPETMQHYGLILGIPDRVRYQAPALESLVANFEAAVDEYIELIEEIGDEELQAYRQEVREISVVVQGVV